MDDIDYSLLNPGIRETVRLLRENGFDTRDSGDGVTREFDCDPGFPYVAIIVENPADLQDEADRLIALLAEFDIEVGYQSEDGQAVAIQASYCPATRKADILLIGLTDEKAKQMQAEAASHG